MNEPAPPRIPDAAVVPRRRRGPQLVWIIPLVAALIGGWLAVKAVLERGPVITIRFKTGDGLEATKTKIKYKDVEIGLVKSVALAEDRSGVVATAELSKAASNLLVEDTRIWVVRPRVSGGSVSGLGTLLGGSYIGLDPGKSTKAQKDYTGLETQPVVALDVPGTHFVLRSDDLGSLDVASPLYFRRVQVGQVVSYELDPDGSGVTLRVFVYAPYDQQVSANTRFWNASGVDVNIDATGLQVDTQSMVSILVGGIAFQTPAVAGAAQGRAQGETRFTLYADRAQALKNPDVVYEDYVAVFKESVRGLSVGAPVDFRGFVVGEVTSIRADLDPTTMAISMLVDLRFYPQRLRHRMREGIAMPRDTIADPRARLAFMVDRGLRAQLRTGNLLTGQLYVALDIFPNAPKVEVNLVEGRPELPAVPGALEELQSSLTRIAGKLEKLPLDAITADLRQVMKSVDRTFQSADRFVNRIDQELAPDVRATLEGLRRSLAGVDGVLSTEAPLQQDLRDTLRDLSKAADSLRALADYVERHPQALLRGKKEDLP